MTWAHLANLAVFVFLNIIRKYVAVANLGENTYVL